MKQFLKKKGIAMMDKIIGIIIGLIAVFLIIGALAGTIASSADNISGSGLPLASLFGSSGAILVIFMLFVFVGIVALAGKMKSGK